MHGDFERVTFDSRRSFADVLIQQGRVLLSADWNERGAIHNHLLRTLIVDLVGRRWRAGDGFTIKYIDGHLTISKGHYYVDGIVCDNPSECRLEDQPNGWAPGVDLDKIQTGDALALFLDCWERHVTAHLDPTLSDTALDGLDAATRVQIAWQVRGLDSTAASDRLSRVSTALKKRMKGPLANGDTAVDPPTQTTVQDVANQLTQPAALDYGLAKAVLDCFDVAPPRLAARVKAAEGDVEPCALAPDAAYRGRENQLYRVEVHHGGPATGQAGGATFKWSRENGAVTFKIRQVEESSTAGGGGNQTRVTVESLGHDRRTGVCVGDWVELIDFRREMNRAAPPLLKVEKIDPQRRVLTLAGEAGTLDDNDEHPRLLRRWDHTPDDDKSGACFIRESSGDAGWMELERGVFVRFALGGLYDTGQYWLIPARVASGGIEWPVTKGIPLSLPPQGVVHHRAILGIAKKSASGWTLDPNQMGVSIPPMAGP